MQVQVRLLLRWVSSPGFCCSLPLTAHPFSLKVARCDGWSGLKICTQSAPPCNTTKLLWPWTSYLASPSLSFSREKMEINITVTIQ